MDSESEDSEQEIKTKKKKMEEKEEEDKEKEKNKEVKEQRKQLLIHPLEVKEHFNKFWQCEKELLSLLYGKLVPCKKENKRDEPFMLKCVGADMFFIEYLVIPPNRFRPESKGQGEESFLHQHTVMLTKILNLNIALKNLLTGKKDKDAKKENEKKKDSEEPMQEDKPNITSSSAIVHKWIELQDAINVFIDSSKATKISEKEKGGIRQLLEKKEGLFRMKMMGKRVDFACRSVISPDLFLNTNEVGIPTFIAKKLTFPEPVNQQNAAFLMRLVINGPDKYPGANVIEDGEGRRVMLVGMSQDQREAVSKTLLNGNKTVLRHLMTGDILMFNRQPTLHKSSIMGHKARVLAKEQTIRMHYCNCSTYNADFDGDEMNAHLVQNQIARSEVQNIMITDSQYIIPTSGRPIRGLIQDSCLSAVYFTSKDHFLNKEQFYELLYIALENALANKVISKIYLVEPAIVKPKPTWTGKQVISSILISLAMAKLEMEDNFRAEDAKDLGLNMESKSKVNASLWGPGNSMEGLVIVRNNHVLTGILDKAQIGASEYGLIHCFYELYGSKMAGELLSSLAKVLTFFLQSFGFTCGMDDLVLLKGADIQRNELIEAAKIDAIFAQAEFANVKKEEGEKDSEFFERVRKGLEIKLLQNSKNDIELDNVVKKSVSSSSSKIIDAVLPKGLYKKFPYNTFFCMVSSGAKGSIVNHSQVSCILGQQELEGRRVPLTPSGKTLPSFKPYDPDPKAGGYITDRFLSGVKAQTFYFHCMAGREGLVDTAVKTSRSGYLQRCLIKQLESLIVQYDMTVRDCDGSIVQFLYGEDSLDPTKVKFLEQHKFNAQNYKPIVNQMKTKSIFSKLNTTEVSKYQKSGKSDPIISQLLPSLYFGSVSDKVSDSLNKYIKLNPDKVITKDGKVTSNNLKIMSFHKYYKSLIHPGESVGTIAGQSIGEPSTQMTLNTFHLAGHGGANVTLGIPRLREILMTASANIKTPIMILPFKKHIPKEHAIKVVNKWKRIKLCNLLKSINATYSVDIANDKRQRKYVIILNFEDIKSIRKAFSVTENDIKQFLRNAFINKLMATINKQFAKSQIHATTKTAKNARYFKEINEEEAQTKKRKASEEDDEIIGENEGYEGSKMLDKKKEIATYDGDDENENNSSNEEDEDANEKEEESEIPKRFVDHLKSLEFIPDEGTFKITLTFPLESKKLLMLEICSGIADSLTFKSIQGVENCFLLDKNGLTLQTQGINIKEAFKHENLFELTKLGTNDIHMINIVYGIEATRNCIVKEIKAVFDVYGICVDYRHLSLIADYMTFNGDVRSFNRMGMEFSPSPLLRMSFESSVNYLTKSCMVMEKDDLKSPSSFITIGETARLGTGMFDLLQC